MLNVIATPIGDYDEITLKALKALQDADIVLCESTKETSKLLRHHNITGKKYELLNEHSTREDLSEILELCRTQNVALVSDCGTPGFHDPGADIVRLCREKNIPIKNYLGASSLMGLISLSGVRLNDFLFRGFLSQETEYREEQWSSLKKEIDQFDRPAVIMDTPYRLKKVLSEIEKHILNYPIILAMNLGTNDELVFSGRIRQIKMNTLPEKAEFMIMILPSNN